LFSCTPWNLSYWHNQEGKYAQSDLIKFDTQFYTCFHLCKNKILFCVMLCYASLMLFYVLGCVKFMCLWIPAINEVKFIMARDYNMSIIILKLLFVKKLHAL
jgi:hypothetical protein